jgi:hypothetical protein
MQELINKIASIAKEADETEDERADRLTDAAAAADVDPVTLMDVEEDIRGIGCLAADRNEEKVAKAEQQLTAFAPMLGIEPEATDDLSAETFIKLLGRFAVERPGATALTVRTLHESFVRHGLYQELGTETPPAGALQETIDVEGGE